jgi:polar amino acid transport system substrate-binding protein/glutamate/aspartate transport system substrate-binding protein
MRIMQVAGRTRGQGLLALVLVGALAGIGAAEASAATLDLIRKDKALRIAYREDARPFSYKDGNGQPAGYMVNLCRAVAKKLGQQLQTSSLKIVYVPVTSTNRFETIQQNKADLLCEATSATLARRELVDFSIATYVGGTSLMIRKDGPRDLKAMGGRKIAVLGGTTTEQALRTALKKAGVAADIQVTKSHEEGLALLDDGTISGYFAERDILTALLRDSKAPDKLMVADNYLTIEPYALALPHGDDPFRLAVDRALSHIYLSEEINQIFERSFSAKAKPSQLLKTLFLTSALPD